MVGDQEKKIKATTGKGWERMGKSSLGSAQLFNVFPREADRLGAWEGERVATEKLRDLLAQSPRELRVGLDAWLSYVADRLGACFHDGYFCLSPCDAGEALMCGLKITGTAETSWRREQDAGWNVNPVEHAKL